MKNKPGFDLENISSLLENSPEAMAFLNIDGVIIKSNEPLNLLFGSEKSIGAGGSIAPFIVSEKKSFLNYLTMVFSVPGIHTEEFSIIREDRNTAVIIKSKKVPGFSGSNELCCSVITDISLYKNTGSGREYKPGEFKSIAELEEVYRRNFTLVQTAHDAFIVCDDDDRIIQWNKGAEAIYGWREKHTLGMKLYSIIPEDKRPGIAELIAKMKKGIEVVSFETEHFASDGRLLNIWVTPVPIEDSKGEVKSYAFIERDMTGRKNVQEELESYRNNLERTIIERTGELVDADKNIEKEINIRKSEEIKKEDAYAELNQIFNTTMIGMAVVDNDYIFKKVNKRFLEFFSLSREMVKGKKCFNLMNNIFCDTENCAIKRIEQGEALVEYELKKRTADNNDQVLLVNAVPLYSRAGMFDGIIFNLIDITEKRNVERKILNTISKERRLIGMDLHDTLGQTLTALGFLVEGIWKKIDQKIDLKTDDLKPIEENIQKSIYQTRKISKILSPISTDAAGVRQAIKDMAESINKIFGVACVIKKKGDFILKDEEIANHIFYIAREAVTNSIKHGKAKNIAIELVSDKHEHLMRIKDDGIGLKMESAKNGLGLSIIRYRASVINALLRYGNIPDRGFVVEVKLKR